MKSRKLDNFSAYSQIRTHTEKSFGRNIEKTAKYSPIKDMSVCVCLCK